VVRLRVNEEGTDFWDTAKDTNWWGQLLWNYVGASGPPFSSTRSVFLRQEGTLTVANIRNLYAPDQAVFADNTYWAKVNRVVFDRVVMGVAPIHHTATGNVGSLVGAITDSDIGFNISGTEESSADDFPDPGGGLIEQERIKYDSFLRTAVTLGYIGIFFNVTRGVDGTAQTAHEAGATFTFDKPGLLHSRSGKAGLFVSAPYSGAAGQPALDAADAGKANDGDLIFDSTAPDFMQVLAKGTDVVPVANLTNGVITPTIKKIETGVRTPYDEENATVRVTWNSLVPNSNVHPDAYPQAWGTPGSTDYVVVPPYLNMDHLNLSNPALTGSTLGYSLTARTVTNPRYIVPGDPVVHSAVTTADGRAEPSFNHDGEKIVWSNTSHIFVTDKVGNYLGTVTAPGDPTNAGGNHSPTWRDRDTTNQLIVWSADGLTNPGGYGNTVIYKSSVNFDSGFTIVTSPTLVSTGHTNFHPSFSKEIGTNNKSRVVYVKGLREDQTIQDEFLSVKVAREEINHRPNQLYWTKRFENPASPPEIFIYSAGADEIISYPKFGPRDASKEKSIVFTVKGDSVDSLGKIMVIDDYSSTPAARQVSPSYLDCSHPTWSADGSKIIFSAANPTRRLCLIDAGAATTPINPYGLVTLDNTVANTSAWFETNTIVSDYLGKGADTDVSVFNKGFGVSNTVDIIFTNGSPYKQHVVSWSLYRMKGT